MVKRKEKKREEIRKVLSPISFTDKINILTNYGVTWFIFKENKK